MAIRTWKAGANGNYTDPANWNEGVAPAPGDTVVITTSEPWFTNPANITQGDTISGQTIYLQAGDGTRPQITAQISYSTFSRDTTINVTGYTPVLMKSYS